jgi:uncharacterized protein YjiK
MKLVKAPLIFLSIVAIHSCGGQKKEFTSPGGYNLSAPDKMIQKESLLEISGIAPLGKGDTMLAVNDEEGKVFLVSWMGKKNRTIKFSSQGDFEDVTHFKHWIFVIRSDGTVYAFSDTTRKKIDATEVNLKLPKGEYESIYADEDMNQLIILTKRPRNKNDANKPDKIFGHSFELLNDSIGNRQSFVIDLGILPQFKGVKKVFAPSAFARNKVTNEWYILSSSQKALLVTTGEWRAKEVHKLDGNMFNQPEGIAFDDENNLYISNEGDELQNGNILKFTFTPSNKRTSNNN